MSFPRSRAWPIQAAITAVICLLLLQACNGTEISTEAETTRTKKTIPENAESIVFGMGCFWGAEKRMSALSGVVDVVSGYAGGDYEDPTYRHVVFSEYLPGKNRNCGGNCNLTRIIRRQADQQVA